MANATAAAAATATNSHGLRNTVREKPCAVVAHGGSFPHLLTESAAVGGSLLDDPGPAPLSCASIRGHRFVPMRALLLTADKLASEEAVLLPVRLTLRRRKPREKPRARPGTATRD